MSTKEFKKRRDSIIKDYKDDPLKLDLELRLLQLEIFNEIAENLDVIGHSIDIVSMKI